VELLVVTLAHTSPGKDAEGLARVRMISDTVRNAPGLMNARFYRSREPDSYYFLLTTWEDEKFWQKAQERYSPRNLLLAADRKLLSAPPEQWLMHYLWGYSRPSAQPDIAAAHVANIRSDQADRIERGWTESLRRQALEPMLAFAFLARGSSEDAMRQNGSPTMSGNRNGSAMALQTYDTVFLNLLSWPGETHRQDFYADQNYKAINTVLKSMGAVRVLALDPFDTPAEGSAGTPSPTIPG
jgi:heme-degrading monooxygenase HmoA